MLAKEILTKLIKDSEGCKLKAYQCPAGIWTIYRLYDTIPTLTVPNHID